MQPENNPYQDPNQPQNPTQNPVPTPGQQYVAGATITPQQPSDPVIQQPTQPIQPTPMPPSSPQPMGGVAPVPPQQPIYPPNPSYNSSKKSTKAKKLLLLSASLLAVAILLMVIDKVLFKNSTSGNNKDSQSQTAAPVTAESLSDYEASCNGAPITNAAAYTGAKPHPIVFMKERDGSEGQFTEFNPILKSNEDSEADYKNPTSVQLVGCLTISDSTKIKTCEMEVSDKPINVDLYSATYELNVYEAKTNKKVATKSVEATSDRCPFFASFDADNPKIYSSPGDEAVETSVSEYINASL